MLFRTWAYIDMAAAEFIAKFIDILKEQRIIIGKGGDVMNSIVAVIQQTIPISLFNRGGAGRIFEDVRKTGPKVVIKNNVAECVLLSPEEYVRLTDELNDARLLLLAQERLEHYDPNKVISQEEIDREFGFKPEGFADANEVDFE